MIRMIHWYVNHLRDLVASFILTFILPPELVSPEENHDI
jgi:hypothetical protein